MDKTVKKKRVLVVDDEPEICKLLENRLVQEGYEVFMAHDGIAGFKKANEMHPDLLILDLMMPGRDGIDVCRDLKSRNETKDIPIIMLTARGSATDEVLGLEIGADDYVTKPYEYRVLSTRIKKALAKSEQIAQQGESLNTVPAFLQAGPIQLDSQRQKVTVDGRLIQLTSLEFRILQCVMVYPGKVFSRKELIEETWRGGLNIESRAVDVHITSLRKKLKPHSDMIETVYGSGYRLKDS